MNNNNNAATMGTSVRPSLRLSHDGTVSNGSCNDDGMTRSSLKDSRMTLVTLWLTDSSTLVSCFVL